MIESVVLKPYVDWHDDNKLALHARINLNRHMTRTVYEKVQRDPHGSIGVRVLADYLPRVVTHNGHLGDNSKRYVDQKSGSVYHLAPIKWPLRSHQSVTYHAHIKPLRPGAHLFTIEINTQINACSLNSESNIPGEQRFTIQFRLVEKVGFFYDKILFCRT